MSLPGGCVQMTPVMWAGFQEEGSHLMDMSEGQKLYHHFTPTPAFSAHASHEKKKYTKVVDSACTITASPIISPCFKSLCFLLPKTPSSPVLSDT